MYYAEERINEVNDFITTVFNHFNGKVNIFQKARLFINWCSIPSTSNGGLTRNPNIVTIYPQVIARYSGNKNTFMINTILIIIHELYHVDQCINYSRMCVDKAYHDMIENTVEVQSTVYLYNHISEINNLLGVEFVLNEEQINAPINFYSDGNLYHRSKFLDHLVSMVVEMFTYEYIMENHIIELIIEYYNIPNSKIIIFINGKVIFVKDNNNLINIDELNAFMYDNYFRYDYIQSSEGYIYGENNELTIELEGQLRNYIAKVK